MDWDVDAVDLLFETDFRSGGINQIDPPSSDPNPFGTRGVGDQLFNLDLNWIGIAEIDMEILNSEARNHCGNDEQKSADGRRNSCVEEDHEAKNVAFVKLRQLACVYEVS